MVPLRRRDVLQRGALCTPKVFASQYLGSRGGQRRGFSIGAARSRQGLCWLRCGAEKLAMVTFWAPSVTIPGLVGSLPAATELALQVQPTRRHFCSRGRASGPGFARRLDCPENRCSFVFVAIGQARVAFGLGPAKIRPQPEARLRKLKYDYDTLSDTQPVSAK
jgi:hypothetical protein